MDTNLLSPEVINQLFLLSGVFVTLKIICFVWLLNHFYTLFGNLGNYLKHNFPKSFLRKIFWSNCDYNSGCELCCTMSVVEIYQTKIK